MYITHIKKVIARLHFFIVRSTITDKQHQVRNFAEVRNFAWHRKRTWNWNSESNQTQSGSCHF